MPSIQWNRRWAEDLAKPTQPGDEEFYGRRWGDPNQWLPSYLLAYLLGKVRGPGDLRRVAREFVRPFVRPDSVALEIGPGGGRWTEILLPCREIFLVELNPEFFPYLKGRFPQAVERLRFYQTEGYELNGVECSAVDFVFSFGTFVHIEAEGIAGYLSEIERVLVTRGTAVIQYSAKDKQRARSIDGFADMDASRMEDLARSSRLQIVRHDTELLDHSNIIQLRKT